MAQIYQTGNRGPMASPWRKRRMCIVDAGVPAPAALEAITGQGALISSNARFTPGETLTLRHPAAGEISGEVTAIGDNGVELAFAEDEASVAFALSAITADMTRES